MLPASPPPPRNRVMVCRMLHLELELERPCMLGRGHPPPRAARCRHPLSRQVSAKQRAAAQQVEDEKAELAARLVHMEQQLELGQQGWEQRQAAAQADREAEQQRVQETLEASEARWTEEIMRIRQDALDEQVQRVSQMQVSSCAL